MQTMHLFAGAGGGLLADLILGHTPIVAVEWDRYACQVLRERADEGWFQCLHVLEGDVRMFDPSDYKGRVGCIHAGFPCTDISVAGKQAGIGEETRSGLYREVLRIAGVVRPKYLFLENVAAIVTNGLGTVLGDLAALGYDSEWLCLRASDCGANHHRDRWWLLANANELGCTTGKTGESRRTLCDIHRDDSPDERGRHELDAWTGWRGEVLAHAKREREQRIISGVIDSQEREKSGERPSGPCGYGKGWWSTEPDVCRVANGVASRVHRLKALGNGQVPLQAATAWALLGGPVGYLNG